MSLPRGIAERRDWFLTHNPSASGMCSQHVWHALGGNEGKPPAWGCANANEVYDKVIASGRYWTSTPIPKGAAIYWRYSGNGHAALSDGDGKILTTDPSGSAMTGVESLSYPEKAFGASASKRIWTDTYNSVRFEIGDEVSHGDVYLSKLHKGQQDSDSVKRLQLHLNDHVLADGSTLPITGNFGDQTMHEITLDREQHGFPDTSEQVSEAQSRHLIPFGECGCVLKVDTTTTTPPDPVDPPAAHDGGQVWDHYSGKPSGTLTVNADDGYVRLDANTDPAPGDGLEFHMIYINCDLSWSGSSAGAIRIKYVRDDGDATGYQDYTVRNGASDFLITATHWEAGEKGVGGSWFINVGGGITKAVIGTRYMKAGGVTYTAPTETTVPQGL